MADKQETLSRRTLLGAGIVASAAPLVSAQQAQALPRVGSAVLEMPAPPSAQDTSQALQAAINEAAVQGRILQLGAGIFSCSGLSLPSRLVLRGVPGHTRLLLNGDGPLVKSAGTHHIQLTGLIFDGAHLPLSDDVSALLAFSRCEHLTVNSCEINRSAASAFLLERCSGSITGNKIQDIERVAVLSYNANALTIEGNNIRDCGDGGILVHRWSQGYDGTLVCNNRISQVSSKNGGTGQNGNGINIFRADGVTVSNNKISDCTFSAIRSNASSNIQILGNTCHRSGEVALFVEFGFQGAIVSNNLIEKAANGISITNFREGGRLAVCSNNILRDITGTGPYAQNNPEFGVGIAVEADTNVIGNLVEGARVTGIRLGWGPYMRNLIAAQNTVRSAPIGISISFAAQKQSALISQNITANCAVNIAGFAWDEQVSGDIALSPDELPLMVRVTDNIASAL
ncbi:hypothetical protein PsAD2_00924 [Pseudovibrio axinellae]|uniref:Right handed beta helix domain-containing protein n=1 Tax=Pseudovibrio axinellae TaxID=989403 RepID=A0A166ADM3_9HYPH|nr:TIGR03808 family TAT-translocated repetitive protein [Pseudovibrio axinellae]KZL20932.1 hypothetical protein PsAD2_00924 [Pseudovibrio axinellae]SEP82519.1 twin-arg-translocated uncharacterized repeat-containing protein [Pseudovibrio axinellae]